MVKKKKKDNKLRWRENSPEVVRLRQLIPEAEITLTDRRVLLNFSTKASLERCLGYLLVQYDEAVLELKDIKGWATSWSFDKEGNTTLTWHLSSTAVHLMLQTLKSPVPGK